MRQPENSRKRNSSLLLKIKKIDLNYKFQVLAYEYQRPSPGGVLRKRSSEKVREIHRNASLPESLFNNVAHLRIATLLKSRLWHTCFPMNFAK